MHKQLEKLLRKINRSVVKPLVCAHRGDSRNAPENTLAAFSGAIEHGVEAVEFDIRLTADEHIVIIHDPKLGRTTTGRGWVHNHSLERLRQFDAGSWFTDKFAGQKIPTLEEALELMAGKVIPFIEIKVENKIYSTRLENLLLKTLDKFDMRQSVVIHSFDGGLIQRLHQLDGQLQLALLGPNHPIFLPKWLYGVHLHINHTTPQLVRNVQKWGHWAISWTVNNPHTMGDLIRTGIDGLITDDPALLLKLRKN